MMNIIDHYRQKLCNKIRILKRYEHLPTWKQLSPSEKRAIASNVILQSKINRRLQAEAISLSKAKLKVAAELIPEDSTSLAPDPDPQSTNQPIINIASPPLPPDQKPDRNKEQAKKGDNGPKKSIVQFKKGHTFDKHGSHNTHELQMEAKNTGQSLGQWINDSAAENFIAKNLDKTKNGTVIVKLPEGLGKIVNPDGTFSPATHAVLVPSGSGVKTAYPVPSIFRIR